MKNFSVPSLSRLIAVLLLILSSAAHAGVDEIRQSLQSKFPGVGNIEHIVKTPYAGLYEVVIGDQLLYTDEQGKYIFDGSVIDAKTRSDLTAERRQVLFAIDFDKLPLDLAMKEVKGNGKRKLAIFTDPNCPYCQKLEKELSGVTNVTLYLYLYPIFPGSHEIVRNVLCSSDPVKAWHDWMLKKIRPAKAVCKTRTDEVMALGQKLHVNGTPNLIFGNGIQAPGFLPAAELEKNLDAPKIKPSKL